MSKKYEFVRFYVVNAIRASISRRRTVYPEAKDLVRNEYPIQPIEYCKKEKKNLFRYIYGHLNTEGHFVNIDVVLSPSEGLEEWYFSIWREWMQYMQDQFNLKDELPEDIIGRYKDYAALQRVTLKQFSFLKEGLP